MQGNVAAQFICARKVRPGIGDSTHWNDQFACCSVCTPRGDKYKLISMAARGQEVQASSSSNKKNGECRKS
jgi:hypothetical protein